MVIDLSGERSTSSAGGFGFQLRWLEIESGKLWWQWFWGPVSFSNGGFHCGLQQIWFILLNNEWCHWVSSEFSQKIRAIFTKQGLRIIYYLSAHCLISLLKCSLKMHPPAILNTWFLIPKGAFQFLTKQIKKIYYPHLARFYP